MYRTVASAPNVTDFRGGSEGGMMAESGIRGSRGSPPFLPGIG